MLLKPGHQGLLQLKNDELQALPNSNPFSKKTVSTILPYDSRRLLVGTRSHGLFLYDGQTVYSFKTERDSYLKENKLSCATLINDSTFAFGTSQGGLIIIHKSGKQLLTLDGEHDLISPSIANLYQDKSGILWAAMNSGIAKIEYPSPFSVFDSHNGFKGAVQAITKDHNKIYAGTDRGLFYLDGNRAGMPMFRPIEDSKQRVWFLLPFDTFLLVALSDGLYQLKDDALTPIIHLSIYSLRRSKTDSNKVFIGHTSGLSSIYYKNGRWIKEGKVPGIYDDIHDVIEMPDGTLWLETNVNRIWKVSFEDKNKAFRQPVIKKYGMEKGLPDDVGHLYYFEDQLLFASILYSDKTYHYNETADTFLVDQTFNKRTGLYEENIAITSIDQKGNVWFDLFKDDKTKEKMVAWKQTKGQYPVKNLREGRILKLSGGRFFYEEADSVVWYGGAKDGIIRHDLKVKDKPDTNFNVLIRKVIYKNDSLLFAGIKLHTGKDYSLPFNSNKFRFQYAALSFHNEKANQYQYYLEGFDKDWSSWTTETQRDFTNLSEGDYRFRVRGRNVYGEISKAAIFEFTVLPPWYRTGWAYLLYGLTGIGLIGLIVHWRSEHLRKEKKALEQIVMERTDEIIQQNEQLEDQAQKLKELDHQKSRFFANISHEFRTPLTLIKGPVADAKDHPGETLSQEHIEMINRNADRLLRLVNQLLDLAKFDASMMHFDPSPGDICQFLRVLAASFCSHAEQREMRFHISIPEESRPALFDHDKLENIVYNLLSNAFKFTPDKGEVSMNASITDNVLWITVSDTGKGISKEHLDHIFERFFQGDDTLTREQEGSGIGLALTNDLLSLMDGGITVESIPDNGSTFAIWIPIELVDESTLETQVNIPSFDDKNINIAVEAVSEVVPSHLKDTMENCVILIVEDNDDMRHFIRNQLFDYYHILESTDGENGWATAVSEIPDLVITDLMMPKMDGTELCRKLKNDKRTSHIPVIILTAKAGREHKIEGLETGVDSYLTKPFDRQELLVRVKNLIAQRQQLRERYSQTVLLEPRDIAVSPLDERFLKNVKNLLEGRLSDPGFGVPQMQEALAMSKTQLHRKMKALTDKPPGEFLRNYRLKQAAQILSQQGDSVTQVAYAVGFNNLSYFSKCFKELYEVTPSEYMNSADPE